MTKAKAESNGVGLSKPPPKRQVKKISFAEFWDREQMQRDELIHQIAGSLNFFFGHENFTVEITRTDGVTEFFVIEQVSAEDLALEEWGLR